MKDVSIFPISHHLPALLVVRRAESKYQAVLHIQDAIKNIAVRTLYINMFTVLSISLG